MEAHSNASAVTGQRRLGALAITFFVVAAAGPLVAMAGGIPVTMLLGNGPGVPAVFLFLTVVLLAFSVGYTDMARQVGRAGAFYTLVRHALGTRAGGMAGAVAMLGYTAIQIGLFGMFGAAAQSLLNPIFRSDLPWWAYAGCCLIVAGILGYRKIDVSVAVLGTLCVFEYVAVLLIDLAVVSGDATRVTLAPFSVEMVMAGTPMIGLMMAFGAYIGFEATTIYSEEAREPERSIPQATYASLLIIGVFYTFSSWVMVLAIGPDQVFAKLQAMEDPTQILFEIANEHVGPWLGAIMRILFLSSIFAAVLAFQNTLARYAFTLARDGILPAKLARTHPVFLSPYIGSVVQSALATILMGLFAVSGSDPILTVFAIPTALGTLAILTMLLLASVAVWRFLHAEGARVWRQALAVFSVVSIAFVTTTSALRFDVLAGQETPVVPYLPCLIVVACVIGAFAAESARRRLTGVEQSPPT